LVGAAALFAFRPFSYDKPSGLFLMSPYRILVVDDEETIREILTDYLERAGYSVDAAESGEEALAIASRRVPDLVICDLMMPGLDGFGVLARMRAEPATAAVNFFFLTASNDLADAKVAQLLGVDRYFTKPVCLPDLEAAVKACLAGDTPD
jgi:CheY-like chemotaxis protein